jgi:hypothetical protein
VDEYTTRAAFLSLKGMVMAPYGDIHHGGMLEGMDQTTTLLNLYKDRMYVCDYTAGKVRYVLPMIKYAGTLVTIANPKALQVSPTQGYRFPAARWSAADHRQRLTCHDRI